MGNSKLKRHGFGFLEKGGYLPIGYKKKRSTYFENMGKERMLHLKCIVILILQDKLCVCVCVWIECRDTNFQVSEKSLQYHTFTTLK